MHTRVLTPKHGPSVVVRPLRDGDVDTVLAVFERMSDESRRARFNGSKPRLTASELERLARVDAAHYALVAYLPGDPWPAAIAHLVRGAHGAEIAFAVADEYQRRGIGSALTGELLADARAAGVTEVTAFLTGENRAALALLRRVLRPLQVTYQGPELAVRGVLA